MFLNLLKALFSLLYPTVQGLSLLSLTQLRVHVHICIYELHVHICNCLICFTCTCISFFTYVWFQLVFEVETGRQSRMGSTDREWHWAQYLYIILKQYNTNKRHFNTRPQRTSHDSLTLSFPDLLIDMVQKRQRRGERTWSINKERPPQNSKFNFLENNKA